MADWKDFAENMAAAAAIHEEDAAALAAHYGMRRELLKEDLERLSKRLPEDDPLLTDLREDVDNLELAIRAIGHRIELLRERPKPPDPATFTVTGAVRDAAGAVLPGVEVLARSPDGKAVLIVKTSAAGEYQVKLSLDAGSPWVGVKSVRLSVTAGNQKAEAELAITPGASVKKDLVLPGASTTGTVPKDTPPKDTPGPVKLPSTKKPG